MLAMTTYAATSRILFIEDRARAYDSSARVRRFRMARLEDVNPRPGLRAVESRFAHLKRVYD